MTDLKDRTALVTGASRGIGRAIAERLGGDGATVAVRYASDEAAANDVVVSIEVLGRTLAQQLGPRGITVNSVRPGVVETDMGSWVDSAPGVREGVVSTVALGRLGQPADVADVVAFLVSDQARWITGQSLDASGGSWLGPAG